MDAAMNWIKKNFFQSPVNTIISIFLVWVIYKISIPMLDWLIFDSLFNSSAEECRNSTGACWSFIQQKWAFIVFGRYPADERWRPLAAIIGFIALLVFSKNQKRWNKSLGVIWLSYLMIAFGLMYGGLMSLKRVETDLWGGFPLTMILSAIGIAAGYPLGIILAIARRSEMPIIKTISVVYIEVIRGVPLITILFMASIMLPLFLPDGFHVNDLIRAQLAIIFFAAAYFAEVVRGGLQAVPKGQYEAAKSLGLSTRQSLSLIILPQALRMVIPATVGTCIAIFKDTSLVLIVGLMDLMLTSKTATVDISWQGFSTEAYLFTGFIYFLCCYALTHYSRILEQDYKPR